MNTYNIVIFFATGEVGVLKIKSEGLEEAVQEAVAFAEEDKKQEVAAAAYSYGEYTVDKDFLENWPPKGSVTQIFAFD